MRSRIAYSLSLAALLWAGVASALAPNVETYLSDLRTGSEQARLTACQMLPRYGVEALQGLVPLMAVDDQVVAKAAWETARYTANDLSRPGQEALRAPAAQALLPLLSPDKPVPLKMKGLKILAVVIPEGFDVTPVSALLGDAEVGDAARTALERAATTEARKALRDALPKATPEQACAIAASLCSLRDKESIPALAGLTTNADARVRAAAAEAVAWTGDPALAEAVKNVRAQADAATTTEATDAQLRFAEAMAVNGGNWDRAVALFRDVLDNSGEIRFKGAAIVGLARYGDQTVVDPILQAVRAANGALDPVFVTACGYLGGAGASKLIAAAYPGFSPELRLKLIPVLARRADPAVLPAIFDAAKSTDSALRLAGLKALGDTRQLDALPVLSEAAANGTNDEKAAAQDAALRLADSFFAIGFGEEAAKAYLGALQLAQNDTGLRSALQGVAKCPKADAADAVIAAAQKSPGLRADASNALMSVADLRGRTGDKAGAIAAYEAVYTKVNPSPEAVFAVADRMRALGNDPGDVSANLGVVKSWRVVGAIPATEADYDKPLINEPNVDLAAKYPVGDAKVEWRPATVDAKGQMDLLKAIGNAQQCFGYAYAEVVVGQDTDATLLLGSDDGFVLWVNGEQKGEVKANRGFVYDSERADVHLKAGVNTILLKVYQNAMGWGYCVRLIDKDGKGVAFTQP